MTFGPEGRVIQADATAPFLSSHQNGREKESLRECSVWAAEKECCCRSPSRAISHGSV